MAQKEERENMSEDMSTPYLLTLLSDRIEEIKKMIHKLSEQDAGCPEWHSSESDIMGKLEWIKEISDKRKNVLGIKI